MAFIGSDQRRARLCAVALFGLVAFATSSPSPVASFPSASAHAPVTGVERATHAQGSSLLLIVTEARIVGSGPWTAWLGGAPERTLAVTVRNIGAAPVDQAEIGLKFGRGEAPGTSLEPITIPPLEPGESTIVRRDIDLPRLAIGTYAVEGEISGLGTPVEFRAETSHIPWLLLLIPTLILLQVILVTGRNRVRRRIHEGPHERQQIPEKVLAAAAPDTTEVRTPEAEVSPVRRANPAPEPAQLESMIGEELDDVFRDAMSRHEGTLTNSEWAGVITDLSCRAAERIAERAGLDSGDRHTLRHHLTTEMLAAFGLDAETV